jgi:hypothetical protein
MGWSDRCCAERAMKTLRLSSRLSLACVIFTSGCASQIYEATDGRVYQDKGEPSYEAALASATKDLPCDRAAITVVDHDSFRLSSQEVSVVPSALEGCGHRVTYQVVHVEEDGDVAGRYMMVSRTTTAAVANVAAATAVPAAR